jgi:hypothetical protein
VDEVLAVSSSSRPGQPGTSGVSSPASPVPLALSTSGGRWLIVAAALGSGVAFLDGSVINVALPAIGRELGGGFSVLQWVLDGYLLTRHCCIRRSASMPCPKVRRKAPQEP